MSNSAITKIADEYKDVIKRKKPKGLKASDITDTEGLGGAAVDYLTPLSLFSSRRAGRASALADATGKDPGFLVEHPNTSNLMMGLGGAALGGMAGVAAKDYIPDVPGTRNLWREQRGALVGSAAGGLAALLLATYLRRRKAQEHAKDFDAAQTLTVKNPDINRLGGTLGGATHQAGRMEGLEKILGKRDKDDDQGLGLDLGRHAAGLAGMAAMRHADDDEKRLLAGGLTVADKAINAGQSIGAKSRERELFKDAAAPWYDKSLWGNKDHVFPGVDTSLHADGMSDEDIKSDIQHQDRIRSAAMKVPKAIDDNSVSWNNMVPVGLKRHGPSAQVKAREFLPPTGQDVIRQWAWDAFGRQTPWDLTKHYLGSGQGLKDLWGDYKRAMGRGHAGAVGATAGLAGATGLLAYLLLRNKKKPEETTPVQANPQ